jgi:hypothetical protein
MTHFPVKFINNCGNLPQSRVTRVMPSSQSTWRIAAPIVIGSRPANRQRIRDARPKRHSQWSSNSTQRNIKGRQAYHRYATTPASRYPADNYGASIASRPLGRTNCSPPGRDNHVLHSVPSDRDNHTLHRVQRRDGPLQGQHEPFSLCVIPHNFKSFKVFWVIYDTETCRLLIIHSLGNIIQCWKIWRFLE